MKLSKQTVTKLIKLVIGAAIFIGLRLIPCPEGLTDNAMMFLAIFITAIYCMLVSLAKDFLILLAALILINATGTADFKGTFSAFSSTSVWLLVGAYGIGAAVSKCGLMNRIAFYLLKPFPKTYKGQILAVFTLATIMGPLIPSNSVKCSLLIPFAKSLSTENGYAPRSKGAAGLFAAGFVPSTSTSLAFYSSTSLIIVAMGLLPTQYSDSIHWIVWFKYALVWFIAVSVLMFLAIVIFYRPEFDSKISNEFINQRLKDLGPMTKVEKRAAVVLVLTLVAWITEGIHGFSTTGVALTALISYFLLNVIDTKTFRSNIAWESIIMSGGVVCTANLFSSLGISDWLATAMSPYIQPIFSNIFIFMPLLAILTYLVRTVVISQTASLTIFYVVFGGSAIAAGIHPWLVVLILLTAGGTFHLPYMNTSYLASYGAGGGGDFIEHNDIRKLAFIYMIVNIAGYFISIPWWKLMGIM